jgi:hypothetical protein
MFNAQMKRKEFNMTTYKIIKGYSETFTGRVVAVWHLADAADGYIFDTFSRKCDAVARMKAWINSVEA